MVAMLTKGGSEDHADRIPIVVLSVLYRLWACIRAATMSAWLARAGVLRPKGSGCAAHWQAYELALILAEAKAKGQ
eukprot:7757210-Heterocapsa_arctica.AAC.1